MEIENVKFPLLKYSLMKQTRFFKTQNKLVISYYYVKNQKKPKKFMPYDKNGYRYRLDLQTGELQTYDRSVVDSSIFASVRRSKILINMLLEENVFDWFITLTFDNEKVKRNSPDKVYKAYRNFIKNIIKRFPEMQYITFPELHKNSDYNEQFFHFHMLIGNIHWSKLGFVYSGKVCCSWATFKNGIASEEYFERTKHLHTLKETDGLKVYNVSAFKYGLSTATKIANKSACNYYVKKYVEKSFGTTDIFQKRFFYSRNLKLPEIFKEKITDCMFVSDLQFDNDFKEGILKKYNSSKVKKYVNKNYNTVQYQIDKDFYLESIKHIENGLTPVENEQMPFKPEQLKIKI